ncbi:MAG: glycoside hydrolase family 36 N-terminal domain-containing protein [Pseudomonadota bacterium]
MSTGPSARMTLITISDGPTFLLRNDHLAYAMRVSPEGLLEHLYFGPPLNIAPTPDEPTLRHCTVMLEGHDQLSLNDRAQEYPTAGQGDFGMPALHLVGSENSVLGFRYTSHKVLTGKPIAERLPTARGDYAQTL